MKKYFVFIFICLFISACWFDDIGTQKKYDFIINEKNKCSIDIEKERKIILEYFKNSKYTSKISDKVFSDLILNDDSCENLIFLILSSYKNGGTYFGQCKMLPAKIINDSIIYGKTGMTFIYDNTQAPVDMNLVEELSIKHLLEDGLCFDNELRVDYKYINKWLPNSNKDNVSD